MTDQVEVKFTCTKCGHHELNVADTDDDASAVTCAKCGEPFGTWGEVKSTAKRLVSDKAVAVAKKAFRGIGKRR